MNAQHWGPAKKRLEYRAEPTSLQLRNRPSNKGRAPHRNPGAWLPEVRGVAQADSWIAKADRTINGIAKIQTETFRR